MNALKAYYHLQLLSLGRYWQSFPVVFRIIAILFFSGLLYLFYLIDISPNDWKSSIIIVAAYYVICNRFSFDKVQEILLRNYRVSIPLILLIPTLVLATPFFLINWRFGCSCSILAIVISCTQPGKISIQRRWISFKPVYFFRTGSFQWFSFYRQSGFYVHCVGILMVVMGIIHNNPNLSLVACFFIGSVQGVFSTLRMEPVYFVKAYLNPNRLIREKMVETMYNIAVLQLPLLLLLVCFGSNAYQLLYVFLSVIVLSWLSVAVKYSKYPDELLAQFILFFIALPITMLCLAGRSWFLLGVLSIVVMFYVSMKHHLPTVFSSPCDLI